MSIDINFQSYFLVKHLFLKSIIYFIPKALMLVGKTISTTLVHAMVKNINKIWVCVFTYVYVFMFVFMFRLPGIWKNEQLPFMLFSCLYIFWFLILCTCVYMYIVYSRQVHRGNSMQRKLHWLLQSGRSRSKYWLLVLSDREHFSCL